MTSPVDTDSSEAELGEGKVLRVDYEAQQTGYWCGPAATRFVISARRGAPSPQQFANQLGTTSNGTDWIGQVTNVLNQHFEVGTYVTREMPNDPPTPQQRDRLWNDIVSSIDGGWGIVPDTGAHEVVGRIRDEYKARGWEAGPLGYPTSGEYAVPGGRKSDFEHGSITWRTSTDDFEVRTSPR